MNLQRKSFLTIFIAAFAITAQSQKLYTKSGHVSFSSKSKIENITAETNQAASVINIQTGELQFSIIIKSFRFQKALMEEHFNENYLESDKYPRSTFKGNITDPAKVNFNADGSYPVTVTGDLTIHGVTQKVSAPGTIIIKNAVPQAIASFNILLADYRISIPNLVKDNISPTINISVNCTYNQKL